MNTHFDEPIVISEDQARGGLTGHNVRYVLVWGLTGVIAAFAAIALSYGYDSLQRSLTQALAQSPSALLQALAPYGAVIGLGAVIAGLALGLWSLMPGAARRRARG